MKNNNEKTKVDSVGGGQKVSLATRAGKFSLIFGLGILAATAIYAIWPAGLLEINQKFSTPKTSTPTLAELVAKGIANENKPDLATLSLICSKDLPGAETDGEKVIAAIDKMVDTIKAETTARKGQFEQSPGKYNSSEDYYRMAVMAEILADKFGAKIVDAAPSMLTARDAFIIGATDGKPVTPATMTVLMAALGRKLGYPIAMIQVREKPVLRWDGLSDNKFNIEPTAAGVVSRSDDEYLGRPKATTQPNATQKIFFKSMTANEELAYLLNLRGRCLLSASKLADAQWAFASAHKLSPANKFYLNNLASAVRQEGGPAEPQAAKDSDQKPTGNAPADPMAELQRIQQMNERNRQPAATPAGPQPPRPMTPVVPTPGQPRSPSPYDQ